MPIRFSVDIAFLEKGSQLTLDVLGMAASSDTCDMLISFPIPSQRRTKNFSYSIID
jgi:hypothetical protein